MLPDTGVKEKVVGIDQAVANIIPTGSMIVPSNSDIPLAAEARRSSRSSAKHRKLSHVDDAVDTKLKDSENLPGCNLFGTNNLFL